MLQSFIVYGTAIITMTLLGITASRSFVRGLNIKVSFWKSDIVMIIAIFTTMSGIRYDVGVDYLSYKSIYEDLSGIIPYLHHEFEPGFSWVLKLFAKINAHYSVVFGFFACVQILFLYYAFKKERYLYPFLAFVIMTGGMYFTMMNEIRQSIVWCILIYIMQFASKNKILHYLGWVFLGFLFHRSALLLIPLFFFIVSDRDYFKSIWLQLILVVFAVALSNTNIWNYSIKYIELGVSLLGYDDLYGDISGKMTVFERDYSKRIRYYAPLLLNLGVILYSKNLKKFFAMTNLLRYYNLYFIGVLLSILSYNNTLMQRPARYFTSMQIVIFSYMFYYLWQNRKSNQLSYIIFFTMIVLYIGIFTAFILSDHHTRYKFFWEA